MISHGLMMFDLCLRAMMCNVTCNQCNRKGLSANKFSIQVEGSADPDSPHGARNDQN